MRIGNDGPVKIGMSESIMRRLRHIQWASPWDVEIIRSIDGGRAQEGWFHRHFKANHIRGGWFAFHADMLTVSPPEDTRGLLGDWDEARRMWDTDVTMSGKDISDLVGISITHLHRVLGDRPWMNGIDATGMTPIEKARVARIESGRLGPKEKLADPALRKRAARLWADPEKTKAMVAEEIGVSVMTLHRHLGPKTEAERKAKKDAR